MIGMICPKCKSDIQEGAKFCATCGESWSQINNDTTCNVVARKKVCSSCGAEIKETALFCTNCGAKQQEEFDKIQPAIAKSKKNDAKKYRYSGCFFKVILLFILLIIISGCLLFHFYDDISDNSTIKVYITNLMTVIDKNKDSINLNKLENEIKQTENIVPGKSQKPNLVETLNQDDLKKYLSTRIKELYHGVYSGIEFIESFCSHEFNYLDSYAYRLACKKDEVLSYRDYDEWIDAQDHEDISINVLSVTIINDKKAKVKYKVVDSYFGLLTEKIATMIYEVDGWYVDDLCSTDDLKSEKQYMKNYITKLGGTVKIPKYEKPKIKKYKFEGFINEKYPIEMTLHVNGDAIKGKYHYVKTGSGADLMLKGAVDENGDWKLNEFDKSNKWTGTFNGTYFQKEFSGMFTPTNKESMPFKCTISKNNF